MALVDNDSGDLRIKMADLLKHPDATREIAASSAGTFRRRYLTSDTGDCAGRPVPFLGAALTTPDWGRARRPVFVLYCSSCSWQCRVLAPGTAFAPAGAASYTRECAWRLVFAVVLALARRWRLFPELGLESMLSLLLVWTLKCMLDGPHPFNSCSRCSDAMECVQYQVFALVLAPVPALGSALVVPNTGECPAACARSRSRSRSSLKTAPVLRECAESPAYALVLALARRWRLFRVWAWGVC